MTKGEMKQEIGMLQQELQDYSDLFDLQQTRMKEAVALWQKATGEKYLPDLGVLLGWLIRKASPTTHNHVWRHGPMPTEMKDKAALLDAIVRSGADGYWLRDGEIALGKELESDGVVTLCCGGKAATFSKPNAVLSGNGKPEGNR
jgi:hypothetical protein